MVTSSALLHGNADRLLGFSPEEHPLALQLGGSDPSEMARAAEIAVPYNFDEININVGCPSDRVQSGRFGACLMEDPEQVARLVESISRRVEVPVTVKHRIGIDDLDSYAHLFHFVETVSNAGCSVFIIHARKAWLKGLSPKENRSVPPLRYDVVYQIKRDFPHLKVVLNGGVTSLDQVEDHLRHVDGVMVGREAYQNPYMLAHADSVVFGDASPVRTRREIVEAMLPYIEKCSQDGVYLSRITRHMLGLFQGKPGARAWKRHLSERAHLEGANAQDIRDALSCLPVSVLDEAV